MGNPSDTTTSQDIKPAAKIEVQEIDDSVSSYTPLRTQPDTIVFTATLRVPGSQAESISNMEPPFWIAPFPCVFLKAYERHTTKATDSSASLRLYKTPSGLGVTSGTALVNSISLATDNSVVTSYSPTAAKTDCYLETGDALSAPNHAGSLTDLRAVTLTCLLKVNLKDLPT